MKRWRRLRRTERSHADSLTTLLSCRCSEGRGISIIAASRLDTRNLFLNRARARVVERALNSRHFSSACTHAVLTTAVKPKPIRSPITIRSAARRYKPAHIVTPRNPDPTINLARPGTVNAVASIAALYIGREIIGGDKLTRRTGKVSLSLIYGRSRTSASACRVDIRLITV